MPILQKKKKVIQNRAATKKNLRRESKVSAQQIFS